jgi:hypothetical protein
MRLRDVTANDIFFKSLVATMMRSLAPLGMTGVCGDDGE